MIPAHLEYLFLIFTYVLILGLLLREVVAEVIVRRSFWLSALALVATWAAIETHALHRGWWVFDPRKICGLGLLGVPLEEYLAFFFIHLSTVAIWTTLRGRRELA